MSQEEYSYEIGNGFIEPDEITIRRMAEESSGNQRKFGSEIRETMRQEHSDFDKSRTICNSESKQNNSSDSSSGKTSPITFREITRILDGEPQE